MEPKALREFEAVFESTGHPSAGAASTTDDFGGTDRFALKRKLGAGGFGSVYEAFDRKRNCRVAVKVLARTDPASLTRFKREFRSLSDLSHPNLISMYELIRVEPFWFYTMELIDGVDFLTHVRGAGSDGFFDRFRGAGRQLASGLLALHRAGKLHRDLKPSNVLVARDGRLVILDLGLVTGLERDDWRTVAGTRGYAAPEQASGEGAVEASDWYSAGVMFYQALTGAMPPLGRAEFGLAGVPATISDLVSELLRTDPKTRPGGREVLAALRVEEVPATGGDTAPASLFVGRAPELAALAHAFERARTVTSIAVVHGGSGIGKSALVQRFMANVRRQHPEAVILSSRCYERESVPYRALDGVIDAIAEHLKRLSPLEAERLMPRDVSMLASVFPVLQDVQSIARARRRADAADGQERRRRAFQALKELLARMADEGPVVLFIDDLQWGDIDSLGPLIEIAEPPDSPSMLLVAAYRADEASSSPLLTRLLPAWKAQASPHGWHDVAVGALPVEMARKFAAALLGNDGDREAAQQIAEESGGHPFWICELGRSGGVEGRGAMRLDEVVYRRVRELSPAAQRLLEVLAVAGAPVERQAAGQAAEVGDEETALTAILCQRHFARVRAGGAIETYHDRIRETVARHLDLERAGRLHLRLALAMESRGGAAERIAEHFMRGGEPGRALPYAIGAAHAAGAALAFDAAARLYRMALGNPGLSQIERLPVQRSLGDALSNAGRGAEAAQAYLDGAEISDDPMQRLDLRRLAAEQLLAAGRIDEGLQVLEDVLRSVGMKLRRTRFGMLADYAIWTARLQMRRFRYRQVAVDAIPTRKLIEIDACGTALAGLIIVSPAEALSFISRYLVLGLQIGEPSRIAQGIAMYAAFASFSGSRTADRVRDLLERAKQIADSIAGPASLAVIGVYSTVSMFMKGDWTEVQRLQPVAEGLIEQSKSSNTESPAVLTWHETTLSFTGEASLHFLGEFGALRARVPAEIRDATDRGDRYTTTTYGNRLVPFVRLADDRPEEALRDLATALNGWSLSGFHLQHYFNAYARSEVDLYLGNHRAALDRMKGVWPEMERSFLTRFQLLVIEARSVIARAAIGLAAKGMDVSKALREAEDQANRIEREGAAWGSAVVTLLYAGVASVRGDRAAADRLLARAEAELERAHLQHYLAACRRRRGNHAQALEYCEAQGIRNPARFLDALLPGKWPAL